MDTSTAIAKRQASLGEVVGEEREGEGKESGRANERTGSRERVSPDRR
jgi:hypothetical protein